MRQPYPIPRPAVLAALVIVALPLAGCATIGSLMSPYSEKFSCKNDDHGQCIHPDLAYADAVNDRASRSTPAVTRDKKLLRGQADRTKPSSSAPGAFAGYRDSVYRELQGLIDAPVTPMLRPAETVRTLVLPYADRQRPDRLYMPRYIYSIVDRPAWVVGGYLVDPLPAAAQAPVLGQVRETPSDDGAAAGIAAATDAEAPRP